MQDKIGKREATTLARRKHIVESAAICFIEQGFHQTSVRDIAKRAKISLGNLYNHFENKTALIAEIAALEADSLISVTKVLTGNAPHKKKLEQFIKAHFAATSTPANAILAAEILAESMRSPLIAEGYIRNRQSLITALIPVVEMLFPDAEPELQAELILDTIEGAGNRVAFAKAKKKKATRDALIDWITAKISDA